MRGFIHAQCAHKKANTHLKPEGSTLADRRELCGLEVRETERGEVAVLFSKFGEAVNDDGKLPEEERQRLAEEDQIRVAM